MKMREFPEFYRSKSYKRQLNLLQLWNVWIRLRLDGFSKKRDISLNIGLQTLNLHPILTFYLKQINCEIYTITKKNIVLHIDFCWPYPLTVFYFKRPFVLQINLCYIGKFRYT